MRPFHASLRTVIAAMAFSVSTAVVDGGELSLEEVSGRMRYWSEASASTLFGTKDKEHKYLVMEQDGAGVNNKRIGWEMAGLVALHTGRTLVLPPNMAWWAIDANGTTSRTEDFINLEQLRGGLPVLTFREFVQEEKEALNLPGWAALDSFTGADIQRWTHYAVSNFKLPGTTLEESCDLANYRSDEVVIYANHYPDNRLLNCEDWHELGEPRFLQAAQPWVVPKNAYSLLRNNFVWHEDVFRLAAPIVRELGLFRYVSLHARFKDFKQFNPSSVQSAEGILDKWGSPGAGDQVLLQRVAIRARGLHEGQRLRTVKDPDFVSALQTSARSRARAHLVLQRIAHWVSPGTVMYISTDETDESFLGAFRERGIDARWSRDFFDKADSPIAALVDEDRVRANKLRGCVEQVVCTFGRLFFGTVKSTFSGYITRMRIYADAPQSGLTEATRLFHTMEPTPELIAAVGREVQEWEARGGLMRMDRGSPGVF